MRDPDDRLRVVELAAVPQEIRPGSPEAMLLQECIPTELIELLNCAQNRRAIDV
jgi:hypothetical protein